MSNFGTLHTALDSTYSTYLLLRSRLPFTVYGSRLPCTVYRLPFRFSHGGLYSPPLQRVYGWYMDRGGAPTGHDMGVDEGLFCRKKKRAPPFWPIDQEGGALLFVAFYASCSSHRERACHVHCWTVEWAGLFFLFI